MGSIAEATETSIAAAKHLTDMDAGAVETIRALSLRIDVMDDYFAALADDAAVKDKRPPSQDNVSIPTYLKFCESLGLTPAGRLKFAEAKEKPSGSKLANLRSVQAGKSA